MTAAVLLAALILPARAADLGGHAPPPEARQTAGAETRAEILEEMWQRRILPPDQSSWSPADLELLDEIRRAEPAARAYLSKRFGGDLPWVAQPRDGSLSPAARLTKAGYDKYIFLLSQDAIDYFESKGAPAKDVFHLRDMSGRALFDRSGLLTEPGRAVYARARLNLEVFWTSPAAGRVFGTRRPPGQKP